MITKYNQFIKENISASNNLGAEFAPNGKKSILFQSLVELIGEEQAKIEKEKVNTLEFKKWFGNSKAVDENGEPLLVYHGSPEKFEEFTTKKIGTFGTGEGYGFYFTPNKRIAKSYANDSDNIYAAYLNLNPYSSIKKTITRLQLKKIFMILHEIDPDYALSNYGDINREGLQKVLNYATNLTYNGVENDVDMVSTLISGGIGSIIDVHKAVDKVTKKNGSVSHWIKEEDKIDIYVVSNPTQIKSAVNNNGDFNPHKNSIYENTTIN